MADVVPEGWVAGVRGSSKGSIGRTVGADARGGRPGGLLFTDGRGDLQMDSTMVADDLALDDDVVDDAVFELDESTEDEFNVLICQRIY
jgi:hypothetical protein